MASRIIVTPFTLEGIDPALRSALKGLEGMAVNSVKRIKDYNSMLFTPANFDSLTITSAVYGGMTDAVIWDGYTPIADAQTAYLYDITATQYQYANGWTYAYRTKLFDTNYGLLKKQDTEVVKACESKLQKVGAAALFNNAFTTNWFDGVPFFSASHPYSPVSGMSGYRSNLVTGAFAHDTLQDAIDAGTVLTDPMGRPMEGIASEVWVPPALASYAAYVLNQSQGKASGTPNNDENPYQGLKLVVYPYFATSTMWAVRFKNRGETTTHYSAKVPLHKFAPKENDAHGWKMDMDFCYAFWMSDITEWVGSLGT